MGQLAFANAWDNANAISAQNDSVTINLGPFIAEAKERLVGHGLTIANNIPEVDKSFTIVESGSITKLQGGYRLLEAWRGRSALCVGPRPGNGGAPGEDRASVIDTP